ncbi:MAG: ketoacyl-ACP synthase III [Thermoguttaceae bacterium]|nr:ketoacyl-ACP synthase III [Thermoguttaceae bacterium]MBQ4080613.1 ketoacyl-ACP synthase III [Thermoguttaceae bacterium]MBQ4204840.1 ketoacyl-ACP synthase III [Thermoguttaceae bacterium]MBQ5367266.1 ketoacyl-ACP synthase III [Thermoguttaceae bacterium]
MTRVKIAGTGSYLPERVVTNDELAERLTKTSDEWIYTHTGIKSRHVAAPDESASSMGLIAAKRAMENAGITAQDLGMIMVSTATPDYAPTPLTSCILQDKLGATNAAAFDMSAACCGFIYNMEIAKSFYFNPKYNRPMLLVATEVMTRKVDWNDHKTCILFGDGAGAAVLMPAEDDEPSDIVDSVMKADGSCGQYLLLEGGCRSADSLKHPLSHVLQMAGTQVFTFAIKAIEEVVTTLMKQNNLTFDDIARIIPHQANYRIIQAAGKRLGFENDDKFYINVKDVANTASASIPIVLDEMNRNGELKRGDKLIISGFGAGLTYGGNYIIW